MNVYGVKAFTVCYMYRSGLLAESLHLYLFVSFSYFYFPKSVL